MESSIIRRMLTDILSCNKVSILFAIIICSRAAGFIPSIPDTFYYSACILFAVYCLAKIQKCEILLIILISYIAVQLAILDCPPVFNVWMRFGLFVIMLICVSPLLQSAELIQIRRDILSLCTCFNVFIAIGSFLCYFAGINYMKRGEFDGVLDVGLFGGLATHSMVLGPVAAYASICLVYTAYTERRLIYWVLTFMAFCSVLFSASRSALLSAICGIVITLFSLASSKRAFLKTILVIAIIGTITFPLWRNATNFVMAKQNNNIDNGSVFFSREAKWDNRVEEFRSSPLLGVGFDVVSTSSDDYSPFTGSIEPGSSWLSLLSMLGVIGSAIVIVFISQSITHLRQTRDKRSSILKGLLVFFCIHMFAEGYFLSAGGYLFLMVWLVLSVSFDAIYSSNHDRLLF